MEQKGHEKEELLFYKCSHLKEKCYTRNTKCLVAFSSSKEEKTLPRATRRFENGSFI